MERLTTTATPWREELTRSVRPLESSSVLEEGDFYTGDYAFAGATDSDRSSSPGGALGIGTERGHNAYPGSTVETDVMPTTSRTSSLQWSAGAAFPLEESPAATTHDHRHRHHHREEFTQELPYLEHSSRGRVGRGTEGETPPQDTGSYTWGHGVMEGTGGEVSDWGEGSTRPAEHDTLGPRNEVIFRGMTSAVDHRNVVTGEEDDSTLTATFNRTLLAMDPLLTHSTDVNSHLPSNPYHLVPYVISYNSTMLGNAANATGDPFGMSEGGPPVSLGPEERVSLIILYTLTTMLAVLGNVLVILVFTFGKRSRTDLRIFLINLAFADLVMAIFCMPFTFTMTMLGNWIFSAPMCPIVLYMQTVAVTASVCTNMAIGIDRFWVVSFPLKSRLTKSRSRLVIGLVWCIALGLSVVQLVVGRTRSLDPDGVSGITLCEENWPSEIWRRTYTFFILILTYLLPLSILSIAYGIVAWKLWQRTTPGNADQARDHQQLRSKRKVVGAFQKYLSEHCMEEHPIQVIAPGELDGFIANYILNKKDSKGAEHQPDTLKSVHRAIVRHLRECDYPVDILIDDAFKMSREVLSAKRSTLKQAGLGNKPNRSEGFQANQIELMWDSGALGASTPEILKSTVYYFFNVGFGLRGCHEARQMRWGDVEIKEDEKGLLYLQWNERMSKTRTGREGGHVRSFAPKIFQVPEDASRCPIYFYKSFAARRPEGSMEPTSPFYLTVKQGAVILDNVCYTKQAMGVNMLLGIVKKMATKAGLKGHHTNHSLRRTSCQMLMSANVPPVLVAQLSGHKSLSSLNNYTEASREQQEAMSNILTGVKRKAECLTATVHPMETTPAPPPAIAQPAPAAVALPAANMAVQGAPSSQFQCVIESSQGMFAGAVINGSISLNINYNVAHNTQSNLNMSPSKSQRITE